MIGLNKSEMEFLAFGAGPLAARKAVEKKPIVIKQGNGNLTGAMRTTYDDGSTCDAYFVQNAKTRDDVIAAYKQAFER